MDLFHAISNVTSRLDICKAYGIRSIKTFDKYFTAIRRVRNRCAHVGVLFDYKANEEITSKGPVYLPFEPDRTNLFGAIQVIMYLISVISHNRLADLELDLQTLIDGCKDDNALYTAIKVASGLK